MAMAVMLAAGLDGIENDLDVPTPVDRNIYAMNKKEREENGVLDLPATLYEALQKLVEDEVMREAMGEHLLNHFVESKEIEWDMFRTQVHPWEREQYLNGF